MSKRLRHRGLTGPASTAPIKAILVHERLAIVDRATAPTLYNPSAPMLSTADLQPQGAGKNLQVDFVPDPLRLRGAAGPLQGRAHNFLDDLNGIFAFILYDAEQDAYLIGRDRMGIIPSIPAANTTTSMSPPR